MRKTGIFILSFVFVLLCYNTFISAEKVLQPNGEMPHPVNNEQTEYRLVLITQEVETPFWDKVGSGAIAQAEKEGVTLEVWGSYGNNKEEFLKQIEIALHSKVDGIILQGMDTEDFKNLVNIKAASYGIPIITVANDVPMEESLRRTYVGSDQYEAGRMIAEQLLIDMGSVGNVILMSDNQQAYYQEQRMKGIEDILEEHQTIQIIHAVTPDSREQVISTTHDVLNLTPNADAMIAVNANLVETMIQEISKRFQSDGYYIYSFDDGPESLSLLKEGKLNGIIEQSPEMMGTISVKRMVEWLNGETLPLDMDGYFTDIRILEVTDVQ